MTESRALRLSAPVVLAALAVAGGNACGAVPEYLVDPVAHPHPDCLPADNFLAVGSDPQSPDGAVTAARARVAGQVSSTLKSQQQVERTVVARSGDGGTNARVDKTVKTLVDERVAFAHAELLRTVGQPARTSTGFAALVCLDRAAAADAIAADVDADVAVVNQALRSARDALALDDTPGFVAARNSVTPREARVRAALDQVATLRGMQTADQHESLDGLSWMAAEAARLRSEARLSVQIAPSSAASTATDVAPRVVLDAAGTLGVAAALAANGECAAAPGALLVDVRVVSTCRRGSLGHTCTLSMPTTLSRCGTTTAIGSVDLAGPATGSDPREDLAARRATAAAQGSMANALRTLLIAEVPLDPP